MGDIAVWVLLAAASGIVVASCIGVLAMPGVFPRLHFTAPAATLAPAAVLAAVVVRHGVDASSAAALVVGLTLIATNPILVHATARAVRIHEGGGEWALRPRERENVEQA